MFWGVRAPSALVQRKNFPCTIVPETSQERERARVKDIALILLKRWALDVLEK